MRRIWMLMSVLAAVACSTSPPAEFYLLSAEAQRAASAAELSVGIARVKVADYLQRSEMVSVTDRNQLIVDEYHRWAEPLDSAIMRVLTLNLAALVGSDAVIHMPWTRASAPRWVIDMDIQELKVTPSQVELIAGWRIEDSVSSRMQASRFSVLRRSRTDDSISTVAADISQLLLELSEEIAGSLTVLQADDEAR